MQGCLAWCLLFPLQKNIAIRLNGGCFVRKNLFCINEKLYAFLFIVSVCFVGIYIGLFFSTWESRPSPLWYDLSPYFHKYSIFIMAVCGLQWIIAHYLHKEQECLSGKWCIGMAIFTPGFASLYWIPKVPKYFAYFREGLDDPNLWFERISFMVYTILLVFSLIICINYIICAVQIRKENKAVGWKD